MKITWLLIPIELGLGLSLVLLLVVRGQSSLASGIQYDATLWESQVEATVRYVAKSGVDIGDCNDSAAPCRTVQYAIDQAGTEDEVRIAAGVYTEINAYGGLAQIAYISKTVDLRGGYTLTNWITPDSSNHLTVLDAQGLGRVAYITGSITTTLEGLRLTGGDSGGLGPSVPGGGVYAVNVTVTISGSEIISNTSPDSGGGLFLVHSRAHLNQNTFRANVARFGGGIHGVLSFIWMNSNALIDNIANDNAGGGAFFKSSQVTLQDNMISGNHAPGAGGGAAFDEGSEATLISNTIEANVGSGVLFREIAPGTLLYNTISDNTGGGIIIDGYENNVVIQGNTIRENSTSGIGGGIYAGSGRVEIIENKIISNTAGHSGGGIYGLIYIFRDNLLIGNHAVHYGGGAWIATPPDSDTSYISNNVFQSNSTNYGYGGGLFYYYGDASIISNTFQSNNSRYGGGLYIEEANASLAANIFNKNLASHGGGCYFYNSNVFVQSNTYTDNDISGDGGGIYSWYSTVSVEDNLFRGNVSDVGGGLYLYYSNVELTGNTIISNTGYRMGGGAYLLDSPGTLERNVIAENNAITNWGGGAVLDGSSVTMANNMIVDNRSDWGVGGLLFDRVEEALLSQNTIARNRGGFGDGVFLASDSHITLTNTILVGQDVGIFVSGGINDSSAHLEGTLWGSGAWANGTDWDGDGEIVTGTVNIWGNPGFVNPDSGDYHLGYSSAAIDAGIDSGIPTDIDGEARPAGAGYDIGADEFTGTRTRLFFPILMR